MDLVLERVHEEEDSLVERARRVLAALPAGALLELQGDVRDAVLGAPHSLPMRRSVVVELVAIRGGDAAARGARERTVHAGAHAPLVLATSRVCANGTRTRGIRAGDPCLEAKLFARDASDRMHSCTLHAPLVAVDDADGAIRPVVVPQPVLARGPVDIDRVRADALRLARAEQARLRGTQCVSSADSAARTARFESCMTELRRATAPMFVRLQCGGGHRVLLRVEPGGTGFRREVTLDEKHVRVAWLYHASQRPLTPALREAIEIGPYLAGCEHYQQACSALVHTMHALADTRAVSNAIALEATVREHVVQWGYECTVLAA